MKQLIATVCDIAKEAGALVIDYYRSKHYSVATKSHQFDYVTTADKEADNLIRKRLAQLSIGDAILSEENESFPTSFAGDVWIVDPIDGTYAFVEGTDLFAVMIGLAHDGKPTLGVMYFPVTDTIYWASSGAGAYKQTGSDEPTPLQLTTTSKLSQATVNYSQSVTRYGRAERISSRKKHCKYLTPNDGSNTFGQLLDGKLDAYIHPVPSNGIRDVCAPASIIQEAGGTMLLHDGSPVVFSTDQRELGMLATNGHLTGAIQTLLTTHSPQLHV